MTIFALNILLAIAWGALWNDFSLPILLFGFLAGFAALWLCRDLIPADDRDSYFRMVPQAFILALYFTKELVLSCINVARDVISPNPRLHSAIIRMDLSVKSDLEIFLVANLISLTPGTLTLEVSKDRRFLVIHSIYAKDEAALVQELKSGMEYRVRKVFHP